MVYQLEEAASPKVEEKLKEWQPDKMSREEQWMFVRSLSGIEQKEHNEFFTTYERRTNRTFRRDKIKELLESGDIRGCGNRRAIHKEPWRPEYDEMCLLFMTPEEIKERQDKGMDKKDIIKEAKDMIVTAKWKECQENAWGGAP